ncbi:MAG: glycosyltransferase family 2 protein [Lachnospiraceae bacterium]|uniref:Glycosyltransferase family 2 protein n=1 Tax=Candidatus Weimeria bifida TaxID=2599074 RepID=A0A6N7J269_9FIRM|nr:glycosyltransferase family 2 protein [Candidatus Weimeria bifida]RRF95908.1 MAG: glycosyltransferase family 2 protein [Lachnospiraceae bacterium]
MNKDTDKKGKFSIIVPAHSENEILTHCLESLTDQDYDDIEVLVILNAATEQTRAAARKSAEEHPEIKIFDTDVAGVSNARNIGLENATGDFIGFCDADDWYNQGVIRKAAEVFHSGHSDIVMFGMSCVWPDGKTVDVLKGRNLKLSDEDFVITILTDKKIYGYLWNKFFDRKLIKNILFNDKMTLMEDAEFCLKAAKNNGHLKADYINQIGYFYFQNPNRAVDNVIRNSKHGRSGFIESLDVIAEEFSFSKDEELALSVARTRFAFGPLVMYMQNKIEHKPEFRSMIQNARHEFLKNCHSIYKFKECTTSEKLKTFALELLMRIRKME